MRYGYDSKEKGQAINNLPEPDVGTLTSRYGIDYYGCWHEVKRKKTRKKIQEV